MTTENKAAEIAAYRAHPGINATTIKAGRTSMLHARHAYQRGDIKPTAAMELGSAVHAMLSGMQSVIEYAGTRRGKDWESFAAANPDALILPTESFSAAVAMAENAKSSMLQVEHSDAQRERPLYWKRNGYECKALPDFVAPGVLLDIKTTGSIEPRKIERASYDSGWHVQLGWYALGLANDGCRPDDVFVLAIESKPPFDAVLYRMDDDAIDRGMKEACEIADRFAACLQSGKFPGIANGETLALALPPWVDENTTVDFTDTEKED